MLQSRPAESRADDTVTGFSFHWHGGWLAPLYRTASSGRVRFVSLEHASRSATSTTMLANDARLSEALRPGERTLAPVTIVRRMMRVYHREHAGRPIRVAWMLEELGEPYEITMMTREESKGEGHRARHPLGRVPVLEDEEGFIFESAAICLHLADLHPDAALAPAPGTHDRALLYQWTIFAPAELEPPLIDPPCTPSATPSAPPLRDCALTRPRARFPAPWMAATI
jgi:Glutathione S-transferase, N-terminal domain